jgi:putative N6-adenine-specific DNA methylase
VISLPDVLDCWAVTHPGVESITAGELARLGLPPGASEPGGVAFAAAAADLARANIHLRTASRVLVRIGEFKAVSFADLERRGARVPWDACVAPGGAVRFRVTSRKSRLYHQDAIAERLARAVTAAVPGARIAVGGADDAGTDEQLFVVRFFRDQCTVSADSSGALLHRRGYRLATGKAPLRETLAAAMLLGIGWDGSQPLVDPLCGSGTIPIEAALIARNIAPGAGRSFACESWPAARLVDWNELRASARALVRPAAVAIAGSDRDAGAVAAAMANAARAGVSGDVRFERQALSSAAPPDESSGWIVTNPPYGARVGDRRGLRDLYARLGQLMRGPFTGWNLALLVAAPELAAQLGLPLQERFATTNGGIRVQLAVSG